MVPRSPPSLSARIVLLLSAVLLGHLPAALASAQAAADDSSGHGAHPFVPGFQDGVSGAPDTKVWDIRWPLSFTLLPQDDQRRWGLNLRVVVYAGVYDFRSEERLDLDLRFQSLAATPGVEFLVPVGEAWVLKPFAEIGAAWDFDNNVSLGVWSLGLRTVAAWPVGRIDLTLGTKLQYLSTFTTDLGLEEDLGEITLGLDAAHPLPFRIRGNEAEISLYGIRRQFLDAIITRDDGTPVKVSGSNEIGLAFETDPRTRLWFFQLPRIAVGYRWGDNIRGVRLNLGWPF